MSKILFNILITSIVRDPEDSMSIASGETYVLVEGLEYTKESLDKDHSWNILTFFFINSPRLIELIQKAWNNAKYMVFQASIIKMKNTFTPKPCEGVTVKVHVVIFTLQRSRLRATLDTSFCDSGDMLPGHNSSGLGPLKNEKKIFS